MAIEKRRLVDLENQLRPDLRGYPPWTVSDRMAAALDKLKVHMMGGPPSSGGEWYTDLELDALGAALGELELEGEPGAYMLDSGAVVHLIQDEDGHITPHVEGRVRVGDLPDHVQPYVERMPSDWQLEHEWVWYRSWHGEED